MKNSFNQLQWGKIIIMSAVLSMALVACKSKNEPLQYTGTIIGTLGCYDAENPENFYEGFYIETNTKDTFLSFDLDVMDYEVPYGSYAIPAVSIPYSFVVTELKTDDKRYVHYAPVVQDAMHQPMVVTKERQAIITPAD